MGKSKLKLKINYTFVAIFIGIILIGVSFTIISNELKNEILFAIGIIIIFSGSMLLVFFGFFSIRIENTVAAIIKNFIKGKEINKESGQLTLDENSLDRGNLSINKQNGELSDE